MARCGGRQSGRGFPKGSGVLPPPGAAHFLDAGRAPSPLLIGHIKTALPGISPSIKGCRRTGKAEIPGVHPYIPDAGITGRAAMLLCDLLGQGLPIRGGLVRYIRVILTRRCLAAARAGAARTLAGLAGVAADTARADPLLIPLTDIDRQRLNFAPPPPPFLPGKLKNAVNADPGNAGFPLRQPALLGGDETPELAAFSVIDGVVPLVAVFPGSPGLRLGKGIGLVDAAVKGLAPVLGQGFQDGRSPVVMGKGLPVGAVPGDGTGLGCGCPPPLLRSLKGIGQGRLRFCVGTWQFPLRLGWGSLTDGQYKPSFWVCQAVCGQFPGQLHIPCGCRGEPP